MNKQIATFAAGCFWGVEAKFSKIPGVIETTVGYTGGFVKDPNYRLVCSDTTGHAEAVQICFDSDVISFEDLLEAFWRIHDPTTPNRQGPDYGSQYRSVIFYHDEDQRIKADRSKEQKNTSGLFRFPIVTEIVPADIFYPAEDYHQQYYEKHNLICC